MTDPAGSNFGGVTRRARAFRHRAHRPRGWKCKANHLPPPAHHCPTCLDTVRATSKRSDHTKEMAQKDMQRAALATLPAAQRATPEVAPYITCYIKAHESSQHTLAETHTATRPHVRCGSQMQDFCW
jgi:hypothetical protein